MLRNGADSRPRRALLGYRRAEVDMIVAGLRDALHDARVEIERLERRDPMARIGDEVADMLRSLATSVVAVQDEAEQEAAAIVAAAKEEAARVREEAEVFAEDLVDGLLSTAIVKVSAAAAERERVQRALEEAMTAAEVGLAALEAAGTIDLDALAGRPEAAPVPTNGTGANGHVVAVGRTPATIGAPRAASGT